MPVGARLRRVGPVLDEQGDDLGRAAGVHGGVDGRRRASLVVGVAARVDAAVEQQPDPGRVPGADRGGQRLPRVPGRRRGLAEQQPQAAVPVTAEGSQVEVIRRRDRAALKQQPHEAVVAGAGTGHGGRALQGRPPAGSHRRDRVRAGVKQEPRRGDEPVGPPRIELMPPGGAHGMQRRPPRIGIPPYRHFWIPRNLLPHPLRVPQHERGGQAVPGDLGRLREHPHGPAVPPPDAGGAELRRSLRQSRRVRHRASRPAAASSGISARLPSMGPLCLPLPTFPVLTYGRRSSPAGAANGVTWRSPHSRSAVRTGARSRPAAVSTYSSRGG